MLVFMPLQLSWAAVGNYCRHEIGGATKHIGHHEHKHTAAGASDADYPQVKIATADLDCASCHAGCSHAMPAKAVVSAAFNSVFATASYLFDLAPPPVIRPERPKWHILA